MRKTLDLFDNIPVNINVNEKRLKDIMDSEGVVKDGYSLVVDVDATFINGNTFTHGTRTIREAHQLDDPQTVRKIKNIIVESLNIGAAKLGLKIGKDSLHKYINKFISIFC